MNHRKTNRNGTHDLLRATASRIITSDAGVSTSLVEAVLVTAIAAILASVAMGSAVDRLEDARISQAMADTKMLAMAVQGFMSDTGEAPAYPSGLATSGTDAIYRVLQSEGSDPADATETWPTAAAEKDLIENHLVGNRPGGTGPGYPRIGEISYNRHKGWNGPYVHRVPNSDPWNNRYVLNVQFFTPQGLDLYEEEEDLEVPAGRRMTVVALSAGPNRTIETGFAQLSDEFEAGGDDVLFRIQ